jgi:MFS family permease
VVATVCLAIMALSFGAPWIVVVALKEVAAEVAGARSVPALASSLAWLGSAAGGILMGQVAEKVGVRWTVMIGAAMIGIGLMLSTGGQTWQLYVGHGLFMGILGNGGINAPFYVYVSKWFDRRRGSALALISSGSYVAGALWPPLFERAIATVGWRQTMLWYGLFAIATIVPLAAIFLRRPPEAPSARPTPGLATDGSRVLGLNPNLVFMLLAAASFLCCIPMAMPQGHLVAFCTDLGISATLGATMLSVLLGAAFVSRQIWGWIADRSGGLATLLLGSLCQAVTMAGFLLTQDEIGLFAVSAAFGLGFSGLIPAYVLTLRQLFPAAEAAWRVPTLLLCSGSGMAAGGWVAGLIYDNFGSYGPAFAFGIAANLLNLAILAALNARQRGLAQRD